MDVTSVDWLSVASWTSVVILVFAIVGVFFLIGKERRPLTGPTALFAVLGNAIILWALLQHMGVI